MEDNKVFNSAGEALMIGLLVVLFITPFVVATALSPSYNHEGPKLQANNQTTDTSGRVAGESTLDSDNNKGSDPAELTARDDVLGADTEKVKDIRMLAKQDMRAISLESYSTKEDEGYAAKGNFKFSVEGATEEDVLTFSNEGNTTAAVSVSANQTFYGETYLGPQKINGSIVINLDPGEDVEVSVDAGSSGELTIEAEVL